MRVVRKVLVFKDSIFLPVLCWRLICQITARDKSILLIDSHTIIATEIIIKVAYLAIIYLFGPCFPDMDSLVLATVVSNH